MQLSTMFVIKWIKPVLFNHNKKNEQKKTQLEQELYIKKINKKKSQNFKINIK